MKRRLLSFLLCICMVLTMLPATAFAALLDNDPAYNREILAQLREICGSEEEAERYYTLLQQYGLLDEDGSVMDSWTITMDGQEVTLADLRAVLAGDYDPEKLVLVDGTPITLGDLDTVLQIEDYIAYLRETYFSGGEWTQEQLASLQSLQEQINTRGIMMLGVNDEGTVGASGVDHSARVSVAYSFLEEENQTAVVVTVTLNHALQSDVTFKWSIAAGSMSAYSLPADSHEATIPAGSCSAEFRGYCATSVGLDGDGCHGERSFFIQLYDLKGALFTNGKKAMTLPVTVDGFTDTAGILDLDTDAIKLRYEGEKSTSYVYIRGEGGYSQNIPWTDADKKLWSAWGGESGLKANGAMYITDVSGSAYESYYASKNAEGSSSASRYLTAMNCYDEETYYPLVMYGWATDSNGSVTLYNETNPLASGYSYSQSIGWFAQETYQRRTDSNGQQYLTITFGHYKDGGCLEKDDMDYPGNDINCTLVIKETLAPIVDHISIPNNSLGSEGYYPGQIVPIVVEFSEPVRASDAVLTINGTKCYPVESEDTISSILAFGYTVQDIDTTTLGNSAIEIQACDFARNALDPSADLPEVDNTVTLNSIDRGYTVTGLTATVSNAITEPVLTVTANISDNEKLTTWLAAELTPIDGTYTSQSLFVSVDNTNFKPLTTNSETVTGGTMTAVIDLPLNTGADPVTVMPELYLKDGDTYQVIFGRYDAVEQARAVFITESDLSVSLSVLDKNGAPYSYEDPTSPVIYLQDGPQISASYVLSGSGYSFDGADQFAWTSSDETVANIDQNGVITPTGKAGTVTFTLTANNGGVAGKAVTVTAGTLTFGVGLTPFLNIPNNAITSTSGQDVTLYWTSNLCDKNGDTPTTFTVTVKRGGELVSVEEFTNPMTVTGTKSSPAASVTIPGDVLAYDYQSGANTFTVEVASTYLGKAYMASAVITLESQPARVAFNKLSSYYITDEHPITIGWSISNFDQYSSADLFKFEIMKNGGKVETGTITPGTGDGSGIFTGSYTLSDVSVTAGTDPNSYRDVYTVTIQAKNGTDSTWSYDSFLLYVYDADALKIWVDGVDKSDVTMSNVQRISEMSQEQILALKRDINLKNIISVNYGQYAWSEIADQIAWKSSDSKVASVNYQQGTLYENIENFTYVSYRPTTEFGLSGLSDGTVTVTATHKLAGMSDTLHVTVETLKDKLYLFQCYPQAVTTLTYTNGAGEQKSIQSDATGAAAIYEESGIASDVYCSAESGGVTYLGTFYQDTLKTGEGDWTKLERYPCNNLNLRRAAYAYLYLKDPDGEPYTGSITFRGGVYVNGEYKSGAKFELNDSGSVSLSGTQDQTVTLGSDGKLTVVMDQTQWGLADNAVQASDRVEYVFEIAQGSGATTYYPTFVSINASANQDAFVGSGSAVVNFRKNAGTGKHPFIAMQSVKYDGSYLNVLDSKGSVGPSDSYPQASLTTVVMWWGEDMAEKTPTLRLKTDTGIPISDGEGESTITQTDYPFASGRLTSYTVTLNNDTLFGVVPYKNSAALELEYYADGSTLSRKEALSFKLTNLLGVGAAESSSALLGELQGMGNAMGTSADTSGMSTNDIFVNILLKMVASDSYTTGSDSLFSLQLAPTSDPTKFLGFISLCGGGMNDADQVSKINAREDTSNQADFDYTPGLGEMMVLTGLKKPLDYAMDQMDDFNKVLKRKGVSDKTFGISGYMESLIYYDFNEQEWTIQILNGGFKAGGGLSYAWNFNTMCGPVPVTATFTAGGSVDIGMDALSVAYYNQTSETYGMGNDFLTELRLYLYLRAFAGVGFDYSVVAFKLGIFGQINLEMQFQWLNRPYMEGDGSVVNVADGYSDGNKNGQHYKMDGQVGLEFLVKFLFISYEKVLCSYSFNAFDKNTGEWTTIQKSWAANQAGNRKALDDLINSGSVSVTSVGGQQMLSLNLAPTLEDRDYLEEGSFWNDGSVSTFALDQESALASLQYNAYPYANPLVSDDGQLVVYLSDMDSSDVERTRAAFATRNGTSYQMGSGSAVPVAIDDGGYGDSQLSLAGTEDFAVAAWTRQSDTVSKDEGAVLTAEDQMIMMNSSEVCVSIYNGSGWATTQLSSNATPDLAPVVATNGKSGSEARAIVAWRAVSSGSAANLTTFDERDTILYSVYDGSSWSGAQTLYNGTSGAVKAIVAAMLDDGTTAVAYTLDTDSSDTTTADREIVYAVVDKDSKEVSRSVRATNDSYLDENPQLTAVKFGADQRFVLGWYTEQAVASDSASVLDGGGSSTSAQTVSDLRLLDFNAGGVTEQRLPDSISQVADAYDVSITSNFRFTRGSESISDLSILWVERAEKSAAGSGASSVEKDVLKGVKFYTYGQNSELISFTGAVDVAEMPDSTLIDHFDAYVSDPSANEIKTVILGTTYGENGTVTRTAQAAGGETVQYTVPSRTTSMYTATETYQDKIEVPALYVDYQTVKLGAKTQIQFTIDNRGIHAIDALDITVGGETTHYADLNLLPGGSIQLYADYTVPADQVVDPTYTVQANFNTSSGASGTAQTTQTTVYGLRRTAEDLTQAVGTVYLDLPDVAITDASIVSEEKGLRTIQIKLNNSADAALTQDEHKVKLSFFSDAACKKAITELSPITITGQADFNMINEGGYSTQTTFDVGEYVKDSETGAAREIPEDGVKVYVKAEVLDAANGDAVQGEPATNNNYASVTCENLKVRTGKDVTLDSSLSVSGGGSTVTVTLQNNRLTETTTGNLIVTLLDENGQVIASQQSYTGAENSNGLITLTGEQKTTAAPFIFTQKGASVQVTYSDVILGADNANLASLSFSNIPGVTLGSFVAGEDGIYRYTVSTDDLTSTAVMAVAESGLAKVRTAETDEGSNVLSKTVALTPGETSQISVTVTADNGSTKTYILTVQNNGEPVINIDRNAETGYSASVTYDGGNAEIRLTAAAKPETPGYAMAYQWYACDSKGDAITAIPDTVTSNTTSPTLTIPSTIGAGVHYYICSVTRSMLDGSTKTYKSSVASVEVKKASGNRVNPTPLTVDYDGQSHALPEAAAEKAGSTVLYSVDYGTADTPTWSAEAPSFTAVGVHTVWIQATHPNYEETGVVTADVLIQGDPTITEPEVVIDEGFGTSVIYDSASSAVITITATQNPVQAVYQLTYQWYECDMAGGNTRVLTGETANKLTVTSHTDAGVHYYRCRITRSMLDGSTKTYWSSVASVEIIKASTNCVYPTPLTVDHDGQSHALPAAAAEKAGSTLLYSTDAGQTWQESPPAFTDVGVHTVWIKATHPNYEDTGVVTADVLIQGNPTITEPEVVIDEGFGTSVIYDSASSAVITITATQNPVQAAYQLTYQWYECDVAGGNTRELAGKTGNALTVTSNTDAGVHYYICKVTRQLVNGGTRDYWSSVASVQIDQATGNSVTLEGTTVTFNNAPHSLTSVAAVKDNSVFHYSTDGGETWSTTAPEFTAVGVHTVWVYATNRNYVDTEIVTADVVIQENENAQFKLETADINDTYSSYPQAIRNQYSSPEELTAALKSEVTKLGAPENNTTVYEIELLFSLDDGTTWQYATAENFPAAGVTVKLPYPEGTNRYSYNFILKHLITDPLKTGKTVGDFETVDLTLEEDGIRFTADCLSPFVLGWSLRPSSDPSYTVAVEKPEHGTVTVKPARASYNSTVTITAKPDDGYKVGTVTVTTQNGRELTVADKGDHSYTFKMPSGSVSVEVTFVPITCDGGDSCPTHAFTDLSADAWYHEAVDYVLDNGLMGGYGNGNFGPNDTLSRAQLAQILYNREGRPAVSNSGAFNDVPGSMWCADAVTWANANGIVGGYGNGNFGPNDPITREQLAVMLWRYSGSPASSHSLEQFTDEDQIIGYAREAMRWANENGIVNGCGDGTLNPKGKATRAQVAQMLMNFLRNLNP